ncbi:MAG: hypothetical protein SA339_05455 [Methanomassiliicoccus sp.]|nr:hypothetical protein [Methanomassiliicoccus sp.]
MLAVTHLALALVLISLFRLDRNNAFAVLLFGVFIDLDHTFGMVEFVAREGISHSMDYKAAMATNIQWKSMFHSPEAVVLIGPLSISYKYALPFVAWGAHLAMDYAQMNYLGVMSIPEFLFLGLLVVALVGLELRERRRTVPGTTLNGLLLWEAQRLKVWASELPGVSSFRKLIGPLRTSS